MYIQRLTLPHCGEKRNFKNRTTRIDRFYVMGSTMVQVGAFGEIKKTMRLLSKRESHIDMEFICGENQDMILPAHRFIIGAQSR